MLETAGPDAAENEGDGQHGQEQHSHSGNHKNAGPDVEVPGAAGKGYNALIHGQAYNGRQGEMEGMRLQAHAGISHLILPSKRSASHASFRKLAYVVLDERMCQQKTSALETILAAGQKQSVSSLLWNQLGGKRLGGCAVRGKGMYLCVGLALDKGHFVDEENAAERNQAGHEGQQ